MKHAPIIFLLAVLPALSGQASEKPVTPRSQEYIVYVGTYTDKGSQGIYAYRFVTNNGALTPIGIAAQTVNPSFLAVHPNRRFLYAVNEISNYEGRRSGSVSAFAIDGKTGLLTFLNQVSSRGAGPCHLSVDHSGKWLVVANYGGGNVASFPIRDDGRLGAASGFAQHSGSVPNTSKRSPRAHQAVVAPDNRFVFVPDIGLDKVFSYRLTQGDLAPNDPPFAAVAPGSGPRHMAFHPDGKSVFVVSEISSTITAFSYDGAAGKMSELQTTSMLPRNFTGTSYGGDVEVHPNGRFLYGSNRGADTIAIFSIRGRRTKLSLEGLASTLGKFPRHFAIDPSGSYLFVANLNSNNIAVLRIDTKTGALISTGTIVNLTAPACVAFLAVE